MTTTMTKPPAKGAPPPKKGNGLLAKPDDAEPDDQNQDEGAEGEGDEQDGEQASPEEQAAYNKFVNDAYSMIYDKARATTILRSVAGNGNWVHGLAVTTAMIVTRLVSASKQSSQDLSADVVFHGGVEILTDLAHFAEAARLHTYTDQEKQAAVLEAADLSRQLLTKIGAVDPAELQKEFQEVVAADKAGTLDQLVPGASKAAAKGKPLPPAKGPPQQAQPPAGPPGAAPPGPPPGPNAPPFPPAQ